MACPKIVVVVVVVSLRATTLWDVFASGLCGGDRDGWKDR